jgi:hypothetical protein
LTSLTALAIALSILSGDRLLAADDCVAEPNFQRTGTGHWYYRFDRAKHRKCWYLQQPDAKVPETAASDAQSPPKPETEPTPSSFISSLVLNFAGTTDPTTQQGLTRSGSPIAQATHPGRSKNDDAPRKGQPPRMARHSNSDQASAPERQQSVSRSRSKHLDHRNTPLDAATRDALFREFLLWQEKRDTNRATPDVLSRDALFREFMLWQERQGNPMN